MAGPWRFSQNAAHGPYAQWRIPAIGCPPERASRLRRLVALADWKLISRHPSQTARAVAWHCVGRVPDTTTPARRACSLELTWRPVKSNGRSQLQSSIIGYNVPWQGVARRPERKGPLRHLMNPSVPIGAQTESRQRLDPTRAGASDSYVRGDVALHLGPAEEHYTHWPSPTCIVSDGPYGIDGFPGDTRTAESLADWYEPHIEMWSKRSTPATTLWFWNTEIGWASVHPVLRKHGWAYRCCNIWNKGLGHIAGNSNSKTLRQFPVVTEVCAHYVMEPRFPVNGNVLNMQEWLRYEWARTGLPFRLANDACQVRNAATRKYLTADHLWYYPPVQMFERLATYANSQGDPCGKPYFSTDGRSPISSQTWERLRAKFKCEIGITNVWSEPQVAGVERIQGTRSGMKYKFRSLHGSQKPLKFIERIIQCSTDSDDTVWEPFGGLCPGAVVSHRLGRHYRAAELNPEFFVAAVSRLDSL